MLRELGEKNVWGWLVIYIYIYIFFLFFLGCNRTVGITHEKISLEDCWLFFNCRGDSCRRYVPYIRRFVSRAEAFGEEARTIPWDPDHGIVCKKTTAGNVEESIFFCEATTSLRSANLVRSKLETPIISM